MPIEQAVTEALSEAAGELAGRDSFHRQIIDLTSVAIFLVDHEGRIRQANQRMARMFGCALEALEGAEYVSLIHPEERESGRQKMLSLLANEIASVDVDRLYLRADQTEFWGHLTGKRFHDANGKDRGIVAVIADITGRKRDEKYQQLRASMLELLVGGEPLSGILEAIARGVGQLNPALLCRIRLADGEVGQHRSDDMPGDGGDTDAGAPGTAACWSRLIRSPSGQALASFDVHHREAQAPDEHDLAVIEHLAHLARIAMERSLAEEKLSRSEAHYRLLAEEVSDVVWKLDRDYRFTYVSPADERLRGYKAEEVLGHYAFEQMVEEHVATVTDKIQEMQALEQSGTRTGTMSYEVELRCKDGSRVWTEILSTPERAADGSIIGYHGITRDVSERKRAEERLHLAASVFTHAREGIMITDTDGTIVDVNATFSDITGYSRDEALGRNPRMLSSGRHDKELYAAMWRELIGNGYWSGEIWNRRKNGELYAMMQTVSAVRDARGDARQYVALFSDITAFKEHQSQLEHIAHYDALTGLPNRVLHADRLHQGMVEAQRHGQRLAVVCLDLDGFKVINDRHGREVGDQLLIDLSTRMKQTLREGDTLARPSGDEFIALILDLADVAGCEPMLGRLLAAAALPVQVGDRTLQVSASLGIAMYPQDEEVDADQLLRQADQAMYQAKLAGKNRYHIFDAEHDRSVRGLHDSLEHIRRALDEGEFVLHYQPKVNMRSGTVVGAEALIRWQHPERGLLAPALFLPVIEDHPLAVELGEWVIATALTQMALWRAAGLDIPVSVNVGARQLQQADFVERLRWMLAAHPGLRPGDLELEVLETSALEDLVRVSLAIEACREIGVSFALDDFGTGYSSLTYLKRLQVELLKIDQSFVRDMLDDPDDLAILEGVIGMATAFRRQVIAEGMETAEHGAMLLQLGCELAQGYGIARPMPGGELPGWAAAWRPDPAWQDQLLLSRDDLPLLFAGVELRAWIVAIEEFIRGEHDAPRPLAHHQCRFGTWLGVEGLNRYGAQPAFQSIELLHRQAHALTADLHQLQDRGWTPAARLRLHELRGLRDALLEQLQELAPGNRQRAAAD